MVNYVKGNLLDSNCHYICHQVNCRGIMGSGIAKQIREKWPEVYDKYKEACSKVIRLYSKPSEHLLGNIQYCPCSSGQVVVNIFSQDNDGCRYTSYDAFATALNKIRMEIPTKNSIGFPKNIGCGLGGGDWRIVSNMIETILGDTHDVYIYELEEI